MTTFQVDRVGAVRGLHALSPGLRSHVDAALRPGAGDLDERALAAAVSRYKRGDYSFERLVIDGSSQSLAFNVMPGRPVNEELTPRCYFVGREIARAVFDRSYATAMENSPSHVIFISALMQWQKLLYLWACHRTGHLYRPEDAEAFKVWPTHIQCRMPCLVREESNLTQDAFLSRVEETDAGSWTVEGFAIVSRRIGFAGKALIKDIRGKPAG